MARVAIAGASGFVGHHLCESLRTSHTLIGLSRKARPADPHSAISEWRKVNLFSLLEAENTLVGMDYAVYLVHSMLPSARLTQGSFEDIDLIAADNFARAAQKAGVKQIVYLGGLVPDKEKLSKHLASRLEVEKTLGSHQVPVTALRAGLIVGAGGSSFQIMRKLVERLPMMICPKWTETRTQPIHIDNVIQMLSFCVGNPATYGETYDIGGPEVMTYNQMMQVTAKVMNRKRILIPVPLFTPALSRLWVTLVTGAPKELIKPLVESLRHTMVAKDARLAELSGIKLIPFEKSVREELSQPTPKVSSTKRAESNPANVRSVQRLPLPREFDAFRLSEEYFRWLPKLFLGLISVRTLGDKRSFHLKPFPSAALELERSQSRSTPDRVLYYVRGGYLRHSEDKGRFEFRLSWNRKFAIAAIHEFRPRLIWQFYSVTQAKIHLYVMRAFARHLKKLSSL